MFRLPTPRRAHYSLKTRLYSIIAFLGLLPVLGVALALAAVELSRRDDAALDRVARGTINLERVNGLVYAVVMESRGSTCPRIGRRRSRLPRTSSASLASFRMWRARVKPTPLLRSNSTWKI